MLSRPRPFSQESKRFPEYTSRIPTLEKNERPRRVEHFALKPYVVFSVAITMILIGIALQIALHFSIKHHGFPAPPPRKAFSWISPSFLTSFFPTLLIATPLAILWGLTDWAVRWFQPYVVLAQGNAHAEDSLLLDYIAANKFLGLLAAFRKRHWIVLISMLTGLVSNLFQPFAGALITVKAIATTRDTVVHSISTIGLSPDFADLNAFLAAAGFTDAATFQGLPDPPFVMAGWAAAQIERPQNPGLNAQVKWNTTGIRTQSNCEIANSIGVEVTGELGTITASTSQGCTSTATFNVSDASQQYGSAPSNPTTCGMDANTPNHFRPVMFWYVNTLAQKQQAKAVICSPTLLVSNAEVTLNLTDFTLVQVDLLNSYTTPNNVSSGDPLNGRALNAVILDQLADGPFVNARATSIRSGIAGAAFRLASQQPGGLQAQFDNETGFFDETDRIYTQHLSVSAKSVYFVPSDDRIQGELTALEDRLIIDKLAAIALSIVFIAIGLVGIVIHWFHLQIRRKAGLYLTTEPGSIATSVALTSHSGFGQLLYPYDDREMMRRKLQGFRFSLDERTGAVVADENEEYWDPEYRPTGLRQSILMEEKVPGDRSSIKSGKLSFIEEVVPGKENSRSPSPPGPVEMPMTPASAYGSSRYEEVQPLFGRAPSV